MTRWSRRLFLVFRYYFLCIMVVSLFVVVPAWSEDQSVSQTIPRGPSASWSISSPGLDGSTLTSIAVTKNSAKVFVGTTSGEIFMSLDRGKNWRLVKTLSIPVQFLKKVHREGAGYLEKFDFLKEKDIEDLLDVFEQIKEPEIELDEISYDDLDFEDIEWTAVDPSDVELREDIDPDAIDMTELEADDVEDVVISDESYLKNPDEVLSRLEEEQGPAEDAVVSKGQLKKFLGGYRQLFLMIKQIISAETADQHVLYALSPLALFVSFDGGESWRIQKQMEWEKDEFLIAASVNERNTAQLVLLTSAGVQWSVDRGETWKSKEIIFPGEQLRTIQHFGADGGMVALLTNKKLYTGKQDLSWTFSFSPVDFSTAGLIPRELKSLDIIDKTFSLLCTEGMLISRDEGKTWILMKAAGLEGKEISQLIMLQSPPNSFLTQVGSMLYYSDDTGASFKALQVRSELKSLSMFALSGRDAPDLWVVTPDKVGFLTLTADVLSAVRVSPEPHEAEIRTPPPISPLPDYKELRGRAKKAGIWELSDYSRWRSRVRLATFIPELKVYFNFDDHYQERYSYSDVISTMQSDPDHYVIGPRDLAYDEVINQYYSLAFFFNWKLGRLLFSSDEMTIKDRLAKSYKRTNKRETTFRTLYYDRLETTDRLESGEVIDFRTELEMIIRIQEIDAMINAFTGHFSNNKDEGSVRKSLQ